MEGCEKKAQMSTMYCMVHGRGRCESNVHVGVGPKVYGGGRYCRDCYYLNNPDIYGVCRKELMIRGIGKLFPNVSKEVDFETPDVWIYVQMGRRGVEMYRGVYERMGGRRGLVIVVRNLGKLFLRKVLSQGSGWVVTRLYRVFVEDVVDVIRYEIQKKWEGVRFIRMT